jgi:hypothetical protein
MTASMAKTEENRLDWSVQTSVDRTKNRVDPTTESKNVLNSCDRCPDIGTACPRGLIGAQNGVNMRGKAFYLGNVR